MKRGGRGFIALKILWDTVPRVSLSKARAKFLAPLVKTRGIGMTSVLKGYKLSHDRAFSALHLSQVSLFVVVALGGVLDKLQELAQRLALAGFHFQKLDADSERRRASGDDSV